MKCWLCGVEPEEVDEIMAAGSALPIRFVPQWPDGDHEHAVAPPSPADLARLGHGSFVRILGEL